MVRRVPAGKEQDLDLVARRVLATSAAYYGLDVSLVEDWLYDKWCVRLHDEWDDLSEEMQYKLVDPHLIYSSGFHVLLSDRDQGGLVSWLKKAGEYRWMIRAKMFTDHDRKMRYAQASDFHWDRSKPIQ